MFWDLESHRAQIFEQSRRQQHYEFSSASVSWTKGEETRHEAFQQFLVEALATFRSGQVERAAQFRDMLERNERSVSDQEEKRQSSFQSAQSACMEVFKADQERREELVTAFLTDMRTRYENGRLERRAVCGSLVEAVREDFGKMVQEMRIVFDAAQADRESRLRSISVRRDLLLPLYILIYQWLARRPPKAPSLKCHLTNHLTTKCQ